MLTSKQRKSKLPGTISRYPAGTGNQRGISIFCRLRKWRRRGRRKLRVSTMIGLKSWNRVDRLLVVCTSSKRAMGMLTQNWRISGLQGRSSWRSTLIWRWWMLKISSTLSTIYKIWTRRQKKGSSCLNSSTFQSPSTFRTKGCSTNFTCSR